MMDDNPYSDDMNRPDPPVAPDDDAAVTDQSAEQSLKPKSESSSDLLPDLLPQQAPRYEGMALYAPETSQVQVTERASATRPQLPFTIETAQQLLTTLKQEPGLWVSPLIRGITKTGDDALVLSQILYWHAHGKDNRPRARKMIGGVRYLYKTHVQLGRETGVPARRVKRSLKRLKKAGFIDVTFAKAEGVRMSHIRPIVPKIAEAVYAHVMETEQRE
jgi:hypothetical protein